MCKKYKIQCEVRLKLYSIWYCSSETNTGNALGDKRNNSNCVFFHVLSVWCHRLTKITARPWNEEAVMTLSKTNLVGELVRHVSHLPKCLQKGNIEVWSSFLFVHYCTFETSFSHLEKRSGGGHEAWYKQFCSQNHFISSSVSHSIISYLYELIHWRLLFLYRHPSCTITSHHHTVWRHTPVKTSASIQSLAHVWKGKRRIIECDGLKWIKVDSWTNSVL